MISRKNKPNKVYAMKVAGKSNPDTNTMLERDIGKLGSKCRFLVETIATFASKVTSKANNFLYYLKHELSINSSFL